MIKLCKDDTIHFVGIGGIGMSGIAEVMSSLGYNIQGSDQSDGQNIKRLKKSGIKIFLGHNQNNICTRRVSFGSDIYRSSPLHRG